MSRWSPEVFAALIDAYRTHPGNHSMASQMSGLAIKTVKKAWAHGIRHFAGGRPIKLLVQEEQEEARALMLREERQRREDLAGVQRDARTQAVRAFKEEGRLVEMSRSAAGELLLGVRAMLEQAQAVGERVRSKLEAMIADDEANDAHPDQKCPLCDKARNKMDLHQATNILGNLATHTSKVLDLAHKAMQMERLHLGRPETLIGVEAKGSVTLTEGIQRAAAAVAAIESAARRGIQAHELPTLSERSPTRGSS